MQGALQKQKCGYKWMRVGYADTRFSTTILTIALFVISLLAIWTYRDIPKSEWRLFYLLAILLVSVIIYTNLCVWLHERLHCLAFRGTSHETKIFFERKYILFLNGHYRVKGAINYTIMRRALLAPILLSVGLIVVGFFGNLVLPGWWIPIFLTMAVAGIIDMTHDFYMYSQIRVIGNKGRYWDTGKYIEAVWKE